MSVRPIDLQSSVPRSMEINKAIGYEAEKSEIFRQQFKQKLEQDISDEQEVVLELGQTEKLNVDKDGKKKKGNNKSGDEKNKKKKKNKNVASISMFDKSV